jgi:hypothetical protein
LHHQAGIPTQLLVGMVLDAELAYQPGTVPLRAELVTLHHSGQAQQRLAGEASIKQAMKFLAQAQTRNPWLSPLPLALEEVYPERLEKGWFIRDAEGYLLPLPEKFSLGWHLLALAGASGLAMFAEWDGKILTPLSFWTANRLLDCQVVRGIK